MNWSHRTLPLPARLAALGALLIGCLARPAAAQYRLVDLTPTGYDVFDGGGAVSGAQAGSIGIGSASTLWQAVFWTGTPGSLVNLAPGSAPGVPGTYSQAYATDGSQQVGFVELNNLPLASLWTGSAASWVDLNPSVYEMSLATGVSAGQQVGWGVAPPLVVGNDSRFTVYPKGRHATTWQGTAASYQDIHPTNFLTSVCWGVEDGVQVGEGVDMNGMTKALRWTGTSASAVDISPTSDWVGNPAHAQKIRNGQTVGWFTSYGHNHACIWNGPSSTDAVDLHPDAYNWTVGWGTNGVQQVGWGVLSIGDNDYIEHALLWSGSAKSVVDLSQFLPHDWIDSRAIDIAPDGTITITAGYGAIATHVALLVPDQSQPLACRIASVSVDTQQIDVSQLGVDTPLIFPHPVNGTVTLTAPAPPGGAPVTVYNEQTPWSTMTVLVPEGQTSATFVASDPSLVYEMDTIVPQTLFAYYGGDQKITGYITTGPFEAWPGAVRQGIVGFLQLKYPAVADEWVTLGTDNPAIIQVPPKVLLRKGDNVVNYPLDIVPPVKDTLVGVVAVCNEGTAAGVMNVPGNPLPTAQPATLTPSTVIAGQPFTLTVGGSQLMLGATIVVNGVSYPSHFVDSNTLTAAISGSTVSNPSSISVTVVNPHALPSTALTLTVVGPSLSGVSPGTVLVGQPCTLTLKGSNLVSGAQAFVGAFAVPTTSVSGTQLTVNVPGSALPFAGQQQVRVRNPNSDAMSTDPVMLNLNNPTPTIASLSPPSVTAGSAGFTLTVNGTNFVTTSVVQWKGSNLPTTYVSSTQLRASIPAASLVKSGKFTINVKSPSPGGGGSNGVDFVVN